MQSKPTPHAKADELISIILRREEDCYDEFHLVLKEVNPDLAKLLAKDPTRSGNTELN